MNKIIAFAMTLAFPVTGSAAVQEQFEASFGCYEKIGAYTTVTGADQPHRIRGAITTTDRRGFNLQAIAVPAPARQGYYFVDAEGAAFYACPEYTSRPGSREPLTDCRFRVDVNGVMQYFEHTQPAGRRDFFIITDNAMIFGPRNMSDMSQSSLEQARSQVRASFVELAPAPKAVDDDALLIFNTRLLEDLKKAGAAFERHSMESSLPPAFRGSAIYDYLRRLGRCEGMGNSAEVRTEARSQIKMVQRYLDAFPARPRN